MFIEFKWETNRHMQLQVVAMLKLSKARKACVYHCFSTSTPTVAQILKVTLTKPCVLLIKVDVEQ